MGISQIVSYLPFDRWLPLTLSRPSTFDHLLSVVPSFVLNHSDDYVTFYYANGSTLAVKDRESIVGCTFKFLI